MARIRAVTVASGVPNAGSGDVLTLDGLASWSAGFGVGLSWTTIMSTELNSLASGNAIIGGADITNGTGLDRYADFSINLPSAAFTGVGANVSLHIYPLNADGTTYGDSKFGSSAAGPPSGYLAGTIPIVPLTQAQTGSLTRVLIPPGTWRPVFCNNGGVALAATLNLLKYRTYN